MVLKLIRPGLHQPFDNVVGVWSHRVKINCRRSLFHGVVQGIQLDLYLLCVIQGTRYGSPTLIIDLLDCGKVSYAFQNFVLESKAYEEDKQQAGKRE